MFNHQSARTLAIGLDRSWESLPHLPHINPAIVRSGKGKGCAREDLGGWGGNGILRGLRAMVIFQLTWKTFNISAEHRPCTRPSLFRFSPGEGAWSSSSGQFL